MKNLENFNVLEIDKKDLNTINGGSWKWVWRGVKAMGSMIKETLSDPEKYYGDNYDNGPGYGSKL